MKQIVNSAYQEIFTTNARYVILLGGRSAGRSFVASQYALAKLVAPEYFRSAIMRFVLGDIRNSIYREIKDRAEEQDVLEALHIQDQAMNISYGHNSINAAAFRKSSGDQKSKLKSLASYNCVIVEEADEVAQEDFQQLDDSLRTIKSDITIFLLLNAPDKNHWIVKRWFNLIDSGIEGFFMPQLRSDQTDTLFIHTTYRDNIVNLNESTLRNFRNYEKTNPDHYYSMIEGLVSEGARGRIFKGWKPITDAKFDDLPYPSFYGLDFGYTNDPAALVEIKQHNNKVWVRELIYETGMLNVHLSNRMEQLEIDKSKPIYADSAEPKSIDELDGYAWYILPTEKGADSRRARVNYMVPMEVSYTENSTNLAQEAQTYSWALDKHKEPTNEPQDGDDHCMDALTSAVWTARDKGGPLMH